MRLENLPKISSVKRKTRRRGKGVGTGLGKTSGRGHKGQNARSGGFSRRDTFEGGQMPLARRLPYKRGRGFTNVHFTVRYKIVNLDEIEFLAQSHAKIDAAIFLAYGFIKDFNTLVKVLGRGELTKGVTIEAHAFSESALKEIERVGGKAVVVGQEQVEQSE